MPVTISFRGICLFVIHDKRLFEVLMPEAEDGKPREHKNGRHVDNTGANRHFAGIFIPDRKVRRSLKEAEVTISDGSGEGPDAEALQWIPSLSKDDLGDFDELFVDRAPRKTTITLTGGTIATKPARKDRKFQFLEQGDRHDQVDVTYEESVTIKIGTSKPITLDPDTNPTVYVYNFDEKKPEKPMLEEGRSSTKPVIRDDDFKWLFLLAAPTGIDPNRLERWCEGVLPCPVSVLQFGKTTVAGSTCYPAAISEASVSKRRAGRGKKK